MKKIAFAAVVAALLFSITSPSSAGQQSQSGLPPAGDNKVAYYPFDSGGPDHYPLSTFTDKANIVVIFEGTLWELADSTDYHTGWMTTTNRNYHYYSQIIRDIRTLQARGVKVLMNVDDVGLVRECGKRIVIGSAGIERIIRDFAVASGRKSRLRLLSGRAGTGY